MQQVTSHLLRIICMLPRLLQCHTKRQLNCDTQNTLSDNIPLQNNISWLPCVKVGQKRNKCGHENPQKRTHINAGCFMSDKP